MLGRVHMLLESPRLRLLPWSPEDIDAFRPIAIDPEVMRYINNGRPWPDERIREFVQRQIRQFENLNHCYWKLVLKQTNVLCGFCGIQPLAETGEPEIGWWLAQSCW